MLRTPTLSLLAMVLLLPQLHSQDPGPPGPLTSPIDVEKVDVKKSKKPGEGWVLTISCSKTRDIKLPEGAILDLEVRHGITNVHFFTYKMGSKSRFKIVEKTGLVGVAQQLMLRMKLTYEKQPVKVREYIDSQEEVFPKPRKPWLYQYPNQRFDLGDPKGLEAQKVEVREFFKAKIAELYAIDGKFADARKRALDSSGFQKGGKFDPDGWQEWVEKEVREPLRAIQKEIREAPKLKFLKARRDLDKYLMDLSRMVARRSYRGSKSVYEKLGLTPDPMDSSPKNIDANARRSKKSDMNLLRERLVESQQIKDLDG